MTAPGSSLAPRPDHVPVDRVVDFDLYAPPGVAEDYHAAWKTLQERNLPDVVWTPRNGGHWLAIRGRALTEIFQDHQTFSNHIILVPKSVGEEHHLLPTTLDPPEHRVYRGIINPAFVPKRVHALEDTIRRVAVELIEEVRSAGGCNFTTAYAEQLPVRIFLALVDLPMSDAPRLKYLSDQVVRPDGSMTFVEAMNAFSAYLTPYIEARSTRPGTDFLSDIVNARVDGRELTLDERLNLCIQVLIAGLDTVVNFLGFMMLFLARDAGHRRALVADPAKIPAALEEFVRRFGVVTIGRLVTRDLDFHGAALKQGDMIVLPTALHGLDERENPEPLRVDFGRKAHRHSTFGLGVHHCVGAHLARAELRITLEEWLKRIPEFGLAPGARIEMQGGIVGCVKAVPLVWPVRG